MNQCVRSFGAGAALQRCLVTWHLASSWLHRLMICPQFCISQFLNSLGNISIDGLKSDGCEIKVE